MRRSDPELVQRIEVEPAEEVQVDFGTGPTLLEVAGTKRKTWIFRIVLSYSRKAYSEAVLRQDTETFLRCLENAFRAFGGSTLTINTDNLKAAVIKTDWADPELNPKLIDFARHYATTILPCLPGVPEHKGKVENSVRYVKENALAGRKFSSLAELNLALAHWEKTVADLRIHGTTKPRWLNCLRWKSRRCSPCRLVSLPRFGKVRGPSTATATSKWRRLSITCPPNIYAGTCGSVSIVVRFGSSPKVAMGS